MSLYASLLEVESHILPKVFDCLRKSDDESTQSLVVVVSPLIALMKDQVRAMQVHVIRPCAFAMCCFTIVQRIVGMLIRMES